MASFEDLLDGAEETVGVGEHDGVELLALGFVDWAALKGFEIKTDAGDGGLELVGDGVEKGILTLVTTDLPDEEDGVEDDACDENREEYDAENDEGYLPLIEENPADVERDENTDEKAAEGDEEGNGSAASGDVHGLEEV